MPEPVVYRIQSRDYRAGLDGGDEFFEPGDVSPFVSALFHFDEQIGCIAQIELFCIGHVK